MYIYSIYYFIFIAFGTMVVAFYKKSTTQNIFLNTKSKLCFENILFFYNYQIVTNSYKFFNVIIIDPVWY